MRFGARSFDNNWIAEEFPMFLVSASEEANYRPGDGKEFDENPVLFDLFTSFLWPRSARRDGGTCAGEAVDVTGRWVRIEERKKEEERERERERERGCTSTRR